MLIKRNKMDLYEKAVLENAKAENEKNEALIEYVVMMSDVDLPIEEDVEDVSEI